MFAKPIIGEKPGAYRRASSVPMENLACGTRECVPGDMVEKLLHSHMVMNNCCPRANELLMAALGHTLQWLKSTDSVEKLENALIAISCQA